MNATQAGQVGVDPDRERLRGALYSQDNTTLYSDQTVQAFLSIRTKDPARASVFLEDLPHNTVREFLRRVRKSQEGGNSAPQSLPLVYAEDIKDDCIVVPQVVEDLLTAGGLSVKFGASNSGKSYLALHMSCAIARGVDFLGKRTKHGLAVYAAGEGAASIKMRLAAYKRFHGVESFPLAVVPVAVNLLDSDADVRRLIDATKRAEDHYGIAASILIVDTLARAFGGGNENSSEDMGAVIRNADRIREACSVAVKFVHHSGKDESKGSRGHSSLRAATDTEIEVTASDGCIHTCEVVKQRDMGSLGLRLSARFDSMDFGVDQWGKPQTVCVLSDSDSPPRKSERLKLGKNQKLLAAKLRNDGRMVRSEAFAFLRDVGVSRTHCNEVIDSLLTAGVIDDTVAGLRAKT